MKIFWVIVSAVFLLFVTSLQAASNLEVVWKDILDDYSKVEVRDNIKTTLFDYEALIHSETFVSLQRFLKNFPTETLKTESDKLAFWINAFNIASIKRISDYYPIDSIPVNDKTYWTQPCINISGQEYSLDDIRHKIDAFNWPEAFFSLSRGTLSDPDVVVMSSETLASQLQENTQNFLKNKGKGCSIDTSNQDVECSELFQTYLSQWSYETKRLFLEKYLNKPLKKYTFTTLFYSWDINKL